MFANSENLTELDLSNFDTTNVKNYMSMFSGCSGLKELNLSSFNFINGESFKNMFYKINNITIILNGNSKNITDFIKEIPEDAIINYVNTSSKCFN